MSVRLRVEHFSKKQEGEGGSGGTTNLKGEGGGGGGGEMGVGWRGSKKQQLKENKTQIRRLLLMSNSAPQARLITDINGQWLQEQ